MSELIDNLLLAPDGQLDASMKPLIEKWDDPPTALQLLEVIDHCIFAALASGFVLSFLQILYEQTLMAEGTTHEALVPAATWRNQL